MCQPQLIEKTYGDYIEPIDKSDELLWKWCHKKNNELNKALKIIELAKTDAWLFPVHKDMMGEFDFIGKDAILTEWCQKQNAKIKNNELTIVAIQQGIEYGRFGMDEQFVQNNSEEMLKKVSEEHSRRWSESVNESWIEMFKDDDKQKSEEILSDNEADSDCDTSHEVTDLTVKEKTTNEDHNM